MPGLIPIEELFPQEGMQRGTAKGARAGRPQDSVNVAETMAELYATLSPSRGEGPPPSLLQLIRRLAAVIERGARGHVEGDDPARSQSVQEESLDRASERQHAPDGHASAPNRFPGEGPVEGLAQQSSSEPRQSGSYMRRRSRQRRSGHDEEDLLADAGTRAAQACILVGD